MGNGGLSAASIEHFGSAAKDSQWEELRFEPEEMIDVDATRVIAVVPMSGRARGSGIEINRQLTHYG
jgi:hypothetical protein